MSPKLTQRRIAVVLDSTVLLTAVASAAPSPRGGRRLQRAPIPAADLDQRASGPGGDGRGSVTETELGGGESMYEVEVTLGDGTQFEVQLNAAFEVVGTGVDGHEDAADDDEPDE